LKYNPSGQRTLSRTRILLSSPYTSTYTHTHSHHPPGSGISSLVSWTRHPHHTGLSHRDQIGRWPPAPTRRRPPRAPSLRSQTGTTTTTPRDLTMCAARVATPPPTRRSPSSRAAPPRSTSRPSAPATARVTTTTIRRAMPGRASPSSGMYRRPLLPPRDGLIAALLFSIARSSLLFSAGCKQLPRGPLPLAAPLFPPGISPHPRPGP
jgi:hypothetical protein